MARSVDLPRLRSCSSELEELDCRQWQAGMSVVAHGVHLGIRVTDPDILTHIPEYLPYGWEPSDSALVDQLYSLVTAEDHSDNGTPGSSVLYSNGTELLRANDLDEVLRVLEERSQLYVAEMAPARVFVHAGVVGWRGRAILIPGRSFSGKTSLVTELVRGGALYYSDEFALLDAQGRVHPFARPLAIRADGTAGQERCLVEALGGRAGSKPLPVGLVLVSRYRAGARWRPRELSAAQGVLELLANTVPARRRPGTALATLEQAVSRATVLKGVRGEARDMVPKLLAKLGDRAYTDGQLT